MITIFGGIGRLRVRTYFVSQFVRIDLLYSPLTLFRSECDFAHCLDCITAIEIALEISLILKAVSMLT